MSEHNRKFAPGLLLCAGLAVSLAGGLQAQTFQSVFGGSQNDAARGGVVQTNDGGYISVGESQSFGGGTYDVYVVKTDQCGNLQWSATYDIGGEDFGRKIRQTIDDGYVIVGSTTDKDNCCMFNNIFLLKIDVKGNVEWVKTYGGREDDQGWDVQLYNGGKEYVVSGRTASFGAGKYDAYLLHTDFFGSVIEARVYGGDAVDGFNSIAVANDGSGDIYAAGETNSYGLSNQVYVARLNPSLNVIWAFHYGGQADETAYSIINTLKNELVVAGYTSSGTGARDGYILRLTTAGAYVNDRFYFPVAAPVDDEFKEIQELQNGDLAVTGYATKAPNGFGDHDVYLARLTAGLNTIWARVFGAQLREEGFSLALTYDPAANDPTYTIAGFTENWAFGLEDLYLIRADVNGFSGCNENKTAVSEKQPKWGPNRAPTCEPSIIVECNRTAEPVYNDSQKFLCQKCVIPKTFRKDPMDLGLIGNGLHRNTQAVVSSSVAGPTVQGAQR